MFGFTVFTNRGTELFPDGVRAPPPVRVRLEPLRDPDKGSENIFTYKTNTRTIEVFVDQAMSEMSPSELEAVSAGVKEKALARYAGRITQWAQGQRDNIERPMIGHIHHKRYEDRDLVMDYFSHFGAARLDVMIRVDAWGAFFLNNLTDRLCAYVFHDNTTITMVPMGSLDSGSPKKLLRVTQDTGGWEDFRVTQIPLGNSYSAALVNITYDEENYIFNGSGGLKLTPMCSRYKWRDGCKDFAEIEASTTVLAGQGTQVYTDKASAVLDTYNMKFTSSGSQPQDDAVLVNSSGKWWYSVGFKATPPGASFDGDFGQLPGDKQDQIDQAIQEYEDANSSDNTSVEVVSYVWDYTSDGFNHTLDGKKDEKPPAVKKKYNPYEYTNSYGPVDDDEGKPTTINQTTPGVIVGWDNGVGTDIQTTNVNVNVRITGGTNPESTITVSYGDYSYTVQNGGTNYVDQLFWPPSLAGRLWWKDGDSAQWHTDYGTVNDVEEWMHVANDKHLVQGVKADGEKQVKYQGPASGWLEYTVPSGVSGTNGVLLDVPMSRALENVRDWR